MSRRWKIFLIVGLLSTVADQITKIWARAVLPVEGGHGVAVTVIENFFDWRLSQNPGSAFGFLGGIGGARVILSIIGVGALGLIVWMARQARDDQKRMIVALGLVAGGAVGNLIDRIGFGTVTDFIVWKYYTHEWPTFNIADVVLVIGVALLFLDMGKQSKAERDAADSESASKPPKKTGSKQRKRRR